MPEVRLLETCPVYRPSLDQLKDFKAYIDTIKDVGLIHGIVKIILPPECQVRLSAVDPNIPIFATHRESDGAPIDIPLKSLHSFIELAKAAPTPEGYPPFSHNTQVALNTDTLYDNKRSKQVFSPELCYKLVCAVSDDGTGKISKTRNALFAISQSRVTSKAMARQTFPWDLGQLGDILDLLEAPMRCARFVINSYGVTQGFHLADIWIAVPPAHRLAFQNLVQNVYNRGIDFNVRSKLLSYAIPLVKILEAKLTYSCAVQHANEVVVTFPGSYRSTYSLGINLTEGSNFVFDWWAHYEREVRQRSGEVAKESIPILSNNNERPTRFWPGLDADLPPSSGEAQLHSSSNIAPRNNQEGSLPAGPHEAALRVHPRPASEDDGVSFQARYNQAMHVYNQHKANEKEGEPLDPRRPHRYRFSMIDGKLKMESVPSFMPAPLQSAAEEGKEGFVKDNSGYRTRLIGLDCEACLQSVEPRFVCDFGPLLQNIHDPDVTSIPAPECVTCIALGRICSLVGGLLERDSAIPGGWKFVSVAERIERMKGKRVKTE